MKNLFIIILLLAVISSLFSNDFYEILNEDSLLNDSISHFKKQYRLGHFLNSTDSNLIGYNLSNLYVFGINDNQLELLNTYDISYLNLDYRSVNNFIIGDFNNNEIDEIIFFRDKTICLFEWDGHKFQLMEYESPYYIHQCVTGDVTNNGKNELIMSCMDDSLVSIYRQEEFYTFLLPILASLDSGNISFKSINKHDINLRINSAIPSDKLVAIFDIDNNGINELIISNAKSDMSPTYFRVFSWNKNSESFDLSNSFEITNFQLNTKALEYKEINNCVSQNIHPIYLNETNYFLADIWGTNEKFTHSAYLLSVKNDNLILHGKIDEKVCWAKSIFMFQDDSDAIYFLLLYSKRYGRNYKSYYKLGYLHF